MRHRQVERRLTVPDSFALALAKRSGWTLLTGDGPLRELAKAEGVDCHGVLWLFDEFEPNEKFIGALRRTVPPGCGRGRTEGAQNVM